MVSLALGNSITKSIPSTLPVVLGPAFFFFGGAFSGMVTSPLPTSSDSISRKQRIENKKIFREVGQKDKFQVIMVQTRHPQCPTRQQMSCRSNGNFPGKISSRTIIFIMFLFVQDEGARICPKVYICSCRLLIVLVHCAIVDHLPQVSTQCCRCHHLLSLVSDLLVLGDDEIHASFRTCELAEIHASFQTC